MTNTIQNRYDFVLLFDVKDGNPNGDPDAGNMPRMDPETGNGLVTDVCIKRKVRNYVQLVKKDEDKSKIFVKEKAILNKQIREEFENIGIDLNEPPSDKKDGDKRKTKGTAQGSEIDKGRDSMCKSYYDIRAFGAVLSTGANAGQVRGPIQITFARSVEQIVPLEHSITVCAARMEEKSIEAQIGIQGRKFTVPYALYRCHGFISASLAEQTGFNEADLNLFWEAMSNMFEHDHSAARGQMATRKLIVFKHDSPMGNGPAHLLFERVKITRKGDANKPARDFSDYNVAVDESPISGVTIEKKI
jgi:CRISPR-associated protein Csd2